MAEILPRRRGMQRLKKRKKIRNKKKQDETRIEREDPYPIYGSTVWKGLTFLKLTVLEYRV